MYLEFHIIAPKNVVCFDHLFFVNYPHMEGWVIEKGEKKMHARRKTFIIIRYLLIFTIE